MGKYCPNCGNEVNENADFCTKCGKSLNNISNQNKKNKSTAPIIISIICIIVIVLIISTKFDNENDNNNINTDSNNNQIINANVGEELLCQSYKVVINKYSYKTGDIDDFQKIPDGEEWIGLIVTVTNISEDDTVMNYTDFNIINSNGEILKPDSLTYKVWGVDSLGGVRLAPNGTKTGYVAFSNSSTDNSNIAVDFQCNRNNFWEFFDKQKYRINLN